MSKQTEVRVGVMGVGHMGQVHTHALHDAAGVALVGVADPDENMAREVAERYGVTAYTDSVELLPAVDAVVITSPENAHADNAIAALEAGKHVLLEKPMADTVEAGQRILDAVHRASGKFVMRYLLRHDQRYAQGKARVDEIGDLSMMYARRRGVRAVAHRVAQWSPPVFYMGVHDIDQMLWYSGSEVVEVYAASSFKVLGDGLPDGLMAILKFDNGAIATLEVNWILPNEFNAPLESTLEVFGKNGFIRVNSLDQGVQACIQGEGYEFPDVMHWPTINSRITGDVRRQLDHFMRVIRTYEEPLCTAEDGFESLRVAQAIIESIESGKIVRLARTSRPASNEGARHASPV